jgi:glycosyltransferase involved in cell wall biosynthesis
MKSLIILSSRFPYPPGEDFLTNEVEELSKYFSTIKILPTTSELDKNNRKELPDNVSVIEKSITASRLTRTLKLLGDFQAMAWFFKELPNAAKFGLTGALKLLNWTAISSEIKTEIKMKVYEKDAIYYSYWLTPSATALAMLKASGDIKNAVSRVHRGDLYSEFQQPPYLPFQFRVIQTLDQTFSISEDGKNYLTERYSLPSGKVSVSRLGTRNTYIYQSETVKAQTLRIISCSFLKPVKRVHLIVEALKHVKAPVEWTHIGDGPERNKLEEMLKEVPPHVSIRFLGSLSNKEVLENYQKNQYDLFINVSESEGIPVTLMEASSFGTPVIATDVGGTSEIVDDRNGYLLPKDFRSEKLAELIDTFYHLDLETRNRKSQNAYEKWNQEYNAVVNYQKFADSLKGVSE